LGCLNISLKFGDYIPLKVDNCMSSAPKFKDLYKSLITDMSKDAANFTPLTKLADLIHRPAGEIIFVSILLVVTLTVFGVGCDFFLILIGCSYAGFMSLKVSIFHLCRRPKVQARRIAANGLRTGSYSALLSLSTKCSNCCYSSSRSTNCCGC
jgi:hypothetical protein